ncbi:MAG: flagellar hook-basal body complex protein FliE [Cellulosilyticaceae bacterium]
MINGIQGLGGMETKGLIEASKAQPTSDVLFTESFKRAKELLGATAEAEQKTTELTYDFITGKDENIHNLMIAQEKSSILLQFTTQVRNNLLEAYREIMRIPV